MHAFVTTLEWKTRTGGILANSISKQVVVIIMVMIELGWHVCWKLLLKHLKKNVVFCH